MRYQLTIVPNRDRARAYFEQDGNGISEARLTEYLAFATKTIKVGSKAEAAEIASESRYQFCTVTITKIG
jgi:hypothetical protein